MTGLGLSADASSDRLTFTRDVRQAVADADFVQKNAPEVVGWARTDPRTVRDALAFYRAVGKRPIHVRKEIPGHAANRLQAALYREVVHLIDQGVLDVADSDDAV